MSDEKNENTGKFTIGGDPSGTEIPSLTRLLNRKSFKREAAAVSTPPVSAPAISPPAPAAMTPTPPAAAAAPELRVKVARREAGVASLHEAPKVTRIGSFDPTQLAAAPAAGEIPWLKHFAELWKKSAPGFGGALLVAMRAKGETWQTTLLIGEPPSVLLEKGAAFEGLQWSEGFTPDCFRLWKQHTNEAVDFEESDVEVTERRTVFSALGIEDGERITFLPARSAKPKELYLVISKGALPHELVAATAQVAAQAPAAPAAKAA